jgi:large conductance mechanosensitive channel
MSYIKDFKTFVFRGNVLELAVAVIIGATFGSIVSSLVDDIITPLLLTPALNAANVQEISKLSWGAVKYGNFLSAVIKFLLNALVLFSILKAMNVLLKKENNTNSLEPSNADKLLAEIRDELIKNRG